MMFKLILCIYKHVKKELHDTFSKKVRLFHLENIYISLKTLVYNVRQLNVDAVDFAVTQVNTRNVLILEQILISKH